MSSATRTVELKRVVVTGLGAVTPLGLNYEDSWRAALNGTSGIKKITQFDASEFDAQIAGEVSDFNPEDYVAKKEIKKMDRFIQLAMATGPSALKDANLAITPEIAKQTGIYIGAGMGGLPGIEAQHSIFLAKGPRRISPFFIPMVIANLAGGFLSIEVGAQGPNFCITSACASGAHSIGEATETIRRGRAKVMIAGGTESVVCPMAMGGFASMKALSTRNNEPEKASRPFDQDRDGFVLGEGCGILVLEELEHALQRGAQIYAEVSGYGLSSDANHITSPAPEGRGGADSMLLALEDASLQPQDIQYINAHGTSTPAGDILETQAIQNVFKEHASQLLVSSTKSMTGHTLGAAGAIESVFCILSLRDQKVAPTINLDSPSAECTLNYVPHKNQTANLKHVLNNSFGFGGTNATLIFSKWES